MAMTNMVRISEKVPGAQHDPFFKFACLFGRSISTYAVAYLSNLGWIRGSFSDGAGNHTFQEQGLFHTRLIRNQDGEGTVAFSGDGFSYLGNAELCGHDYSKDKDTPHLYGVPATYMSFCATIISNRRIDGASDHIRAGVESILRMVNEDLVYRCMNAAYERPIIAQEGAKVQLCRLTANETAKLFFSTPYLASFSKELMPAGFSDLVMGKYSLFDDIGVTFFLREKDDYGLLYVISMIVHACGAWKFSSSYLNDDGQEANVEDLMQGWNEAKKLAASRSVSGQHLRNANEKAFLSKTFKADQLFILKTHVTEVLDSKTLAMLAWVGSSYFLYSKYTVVHNLYSMLFEAIQRDKPHGEMVAALREPDAAMPAVKKPRLHEKQDGIFMVMGMLEE
jgi:hypothetical protein